MKKTLPNIPFFDQCFDKNRLKKLLTQTYHETVLTQTFTLLPFLETLKTLGFQEATKAGISIGIDDLKIPPQKRQLLNTINLKLDQTHRQFSSGQISALENFQNFIDIWHKTSETIKLHVVENFEATDILNPVYMMAFSGARGNLSQVTQLVGMRGFMSDPEGQIIDYPIRSNFREGLTLTEYIISCYGARKGLVDTALRTADAGYLTRRLVDVAHRLIITQANCKTKEGIWVASIKQGSKVIYPLEKRLTGRVLAENVYFSYICEQTGDRLFERWNLFEKNQQIDPVRAKVLASSFKRVLIRSSLRCLKLKRICQLCYGWTLPHAHLAPIGEAVGILAAQSIGEPGTQLTMRTFHTGGVFSGELSDEIRAPYSGVIEYLNSRLCKAEIPLKGRLFRTVTGQIAFLTKEPGALILHKTNLKDLRNDKKTTNSNGIFKLSFPAYSVLFFRNFEEVSTNTILLELPKEQDIDNETVLNTYTVYAKRSGELKLEHNESEHNRAEDIALLTHKKLPKLQPFYQMAQNFYPQLIKFQLYSGQIAQTTFFKDSLLRPGDLVNTKSLTNIAQFTHSSSGNCSLEKAKPGPSNYIRSVGQELPKVFLRNIFFNFDIFSIKYKKNLGYVYLSRFGNIQVRYLLPKLETSLNRFEFTLDSVNNAQTKKILPDFWTNSYQKIDFKSLRLRRMAKKNLEPFYHSRLSLTCFYDEKPYQLTRFKKQIQICGETLSKRSSKPVLLASRWVQANTFLWSQQNFQGQVHESLASKDGFLKIGHLYQDQGDILTKYKLLKPGWPYYTNSIPSLEFYPKQSLHKYVPNKLAAFGEELIFDLIFTAQYTYIDFFLQKIDNKKNLFNKKKIFQRTTNTLINSTKAVYFYLIRPILTQNILAVETKQYKRDLRAVTCQESLFTKFKRVSSKKSFKNIFAQLNKQKIEPYISPNALFKMNTVIDKDSYQVVFFGQSPTSPAQIDFGSNNPFQRSYQISCQKDYSRQVFCTDHLKNVERKQIHLSPSINSNRPISRILYLNPYNGEFLRVSPNNINSVSSGSQTLTLTNMDMRILKLNQSLPLRIGELSTYGFLPYTGEIFSLTRNFIQLRFAEKSIAAANSRVFCEDGQFLNKNTRMFTQSYSRLQMGDIVQGIPKIEEFFEARQTKEGVPFVNSLHNKLNAYFQSYLSFDMPVMIATKKSMADIQNYIIESVFKLYHSQGIQLADKHLEVIVRQMTNKVQVTNLETTHFLPIVSCPLPGELYHFGSIAKWQRWNKWIYLFPNKFRSKEYRLIPWLVRYQPVVIGITQSALANDSFISAASFQETTRMLSQGAIFENTDFLKGLKENVIIGHIIPAGTAVRTYSRYKGAPRMKFVEKAFIYEALTANRNFKRKIKNTQKITLHDLKDDLKELKTNMRIQRFLVKLLVCQYKLSNKFS